MRVSRILQAFATILVLAPCTLARAEANACGAAYEEAQVARSESRLRAARDHLATCMRAECPEFVRNDCARWLNEVELALPSIVLVAKSGAIELEDVQVSIDGAPLRDRIDGKAVTVDPGRHVLHFEATGRAPVDVEVIVHEGDKNRMVEATFANNQPKSAPRAPAEHAPATQAHNRTLPYALFGVGMLGLASFTTFALLGNSDKHGLESRCAPDCPNAEVSTLHTKYVVADVSLAIGAVAIGAASYLLFSAVGEPNKPRATRPTVGLVFTRGSELGTLKLNF